MADAKQGDAELFAAGRRAPDKTQCRSVIVATSPEGVRNYHNCSGDKNHPALLRHGCGCGEEWYTVNGLRWFSEGPLVEVVFAP